MDIFVARQPILTKDEEVFGYELLYRNSQHNAFNHTDGDIATTELLLNSFLGIGNQKLSNGKKLFINFTRNLLLKRVPCLFSPEKIVIEVLEDIEGDFEIIQVIKELKSYGYTIALDDFILNEKSKSLVPYADIIKVDYLLSSEQNRKAIVTFAKQYGIRLLAEKIETRKDFQQASVEGFKYFQGYFFSKPVIISATDVPPFSHKYIQILQELNKTEPDLNKITRFVEHDLSLAYKILKVVNSMAYYTRVKITSIKQAIVILGLNELMKWITILSLKEKHDRSSAASEVMLNCLIRAKFAEEIGVFILGEHSKSECFMVGMFSLLDTILQRPMSQVLEQLPLTEEVKAALEGKPSQYRIILELIDAVEQANWSKLEVLSTRIPPANLTRYYQDALKWATDIHNNI